MDLRFRESDGLDSRGEPHPEAVQLRIDTTLAIVLVGFRGVAAVWLTLLGILALTGSHDPDPLVVWSALVAAWVWTAATAVASRARPQLLLTARWLVPDLAVGLWVLAAPLLDGASEAVNYAGGFPISSVLLWAYVWRYRGALVSAGAATAVIFSLGTFSANGRISIALVYVITAFVAAWAIGVLRRNEAMRKRAEAALEAERTIRLRTEERAEVAARLHDSVLQTLALVQRRAGDPADVRSLARNQERELRQWLYEDWAGRSGTVAVALKELATEIGERHRIHVEVVSVGDCDLDDGTSAAVAACREALTNAAKFAGVDEVSVYAEATPNLLTVFIRDRGTGFDPNAVPAESRGIAESIVGRMERRGGTAEITSAPGKGTEVELRVPRQAKGAAG